MIAISRYPEAEEGRGPCRQPVNIGHAERWISLLGGVGLATAGGVMRNRRGAALALLGTALAYRGIAGRSRLYGWLGINTALRDQEAVERDLARSGIKVEKTLIVMRSPAEVYAFWRNFENLPRILRHVESVVRIGDGLSHWTVKGPFGARFEWDAQVINQRENELIAWQTLDGASVDHAGSVRFAPAPGGGGTLIHVSLKYNHPSSGLIGIGAAKLFGQDPGSEIEEDLQRLKAILEAGEEAGAPLSTALPGRNP